MAAELSEGIHQPRSVKQSKGADRPNGVFVSESFRAGFPKDSGQH